MKRQFSLKSKFQVVVLRSAYGKPRKILVIFVNCKNTYPAMPHFLDELNPAQREAVINYEKPSLIVAGAGSGKTRVLISRIAYMIEQGVYPGAILALTFTNKAAREMRERIERMLPGGQSRYIWMGTFHSVFYRILRSEAQKIGFTSDFTIYDSSNSESLLNTIIKEFQLNTDDYKPRETHSRISLAKNNLVTAEAYASNQSFQTEDRHRKKPEFSRIYLEYARRCKSNNAMDFDDLLLYTNILFRDFPGVTEYYGRRFQYIRVDEYQDTNYAQYLILRRLSQDHSNLCVVGDDAQSIYSFRGAKIENILRFQSDYPSAKLFKLEQNYRSTQNIVAAANSIIAKNSRQIPKTVFSEKSEGDKIKVVKAYTDQEEAHLVAEMIRRLGRENDRHWAEIAVLYRNNSQSRAIEDALRRYDIPYKIYSGHSFYERKEIKDLVAYYRLIVNPKDNEAFRRIINTPARGIGQVSVNRIAALAQVEGKSMWELVSETDLSQTELKSAAGRIRDFVTMITAFSLERNQKPLYDFGLEVATRSGIIGSYKMTPGPESDSALENIGELLNSMQNFKEQRIILAYEEGEEAFDAEPTIEEWLQNISLMTDMDKEEAEVGERVALMTVHAAKGLEFDNVFIVGVEENLFPSMMSITTQEGIEEERRLFYVAVTRAREKAVVTFARSRFRWGNTEFCRPSRLITEIDKNYVELPADMEEEIASEAGQDPLEQLRRRFDTRYKQREGQPSREHSTEPLQPSKRHVDMDKFKSVGSRRAAGDNAPASENIRPSGDSPAGSTPLPPVANSGTGNSPYTPGARVEHSKFGQGEILAVEDMGSDKKITVQFDNPIAGRKSLLAKYANLKAI